MTCAELDRWLDEGMPEADARTARAHAATCARCAAALEATLAIETTFVESSAVARSIPAARAPEGFAAGVMAQVRELEPARIAETPAPRWWIRVLSDPVATVSSVVAVLVLGILIWNPAWMIRLGGSIGAGWLAWVSGTAAMPMNSTLWLAVLATAVPFALWWLWQVGRGVERALVLHMARSSS